MLAWSGLPPLVRRPKRGKALAVSVVLVRSLYRTLVVPVVAPRLGCVARSQYVPGRRRVKIAGWPAVYGWVPARHSAVAAAHVNRSIMIGGGAGVLVQSAASGAVIGTGLAASS